MNGYLQFLEQEIILVEEQIMQGHEVDLQSKIIEMQEAVSILQNGPLDNNERILFNDLLKRIRKIREDIVIYDEDTELDRLFPDRQEEGFDEDSMFNL